MCRFFAIYLDAIALVVLNGYPYWENSDGIMTGTIK
jgi:hypothetical protein